jgi:hypothetical protein
LSQGFFLFHGPNRGLLAGGLKPHHRVCGVVCYTQKVNALLQIRYGKVCGVVSRAKVFIQHKADFPAEAVEDRNSGHSGIGQGKAHRFLIQGDIEIPNVFQRRGSLSDLCSELALVGGEEEEILVDVH